MEDILAGLNNIIWSNALILLCLGAGIYFSVVTRFLQVRYVREMLRLLFKGHSSERGVSSFQAFTIAIAGRVGTGNIAGVATAIAIGGPGAVFWMWVMALLGSATAFIEATLGQIYKEVQDGQYRGGPAYYIGKGLGMKTYAAIFAGVTAFSSALFFPGVQSNSIATSMENAFAVPPVISGIVITVLLAFIIFGGVKRIGKAAEIIVPFMAGAYILMAMIIMVLNFTEIPAILGLIVRSAFHLEPAFAGIFGLAVSWGVKRGIYSNEAGMGSAPHAAAAAETSHPVKQGLVQAFSVYVDTLFVCTATAFMILFTGQYNIENPAGGFLVENLPGAAIGPTYTQAAVDVHFPAFGAGFVAISLFFFAFTTIMAYYYIGETNLSYLTTRTNKWLLALQRILTLAATFYGAIRAAEIVWGLADIGVGIMAWLNVIAVFILQKPALKALKDYQAQRKAGLDPVFDPEKLGIKNADVWEKIPLVAEAPADELQAR
ncbi:alanine/glycine:cation symporter family protein [Pontibacter liquoris]|uniref:alanine/glycine:cation symporter family protein n=1 Tax=Pontibacter liquoris TaxID=2905677 RepID=UPI001FA7BE36|nr:alanine/glycine:cation symporter family protein [Pontibacter liquoris]